MTSDEQGAAKSSDEWRVTIEEQAAAPQSAPSAGVEGAGAATGTGREGTTDRGRSTQLTPPRGKMRELCEPPNPTSAG